MNQKRHNRSNQTRTRDSERPERHKTKIKTHKWNPRPALTHSRSATRGGVFLSHRFVEFRAGSPPSLDEQPPAEPSRPSEGLEAEPSRPSEGLEAELTQQVRPGVLVAMAHGSVLTLVLTLTLVLLMLCSAAEARVRLNSIRTVIIREEPAANRSSWEAGMDLTLYRCMSDLECSEGSFCHAPTRGPAHSRCQACRRRKRRCHRDGMCCPGNSCSSNVCVATEDGSTSQRIAGAHGGPASTEKRRRERGGAEVGGASGTGRVGDPCLRSSDCSDSACCARHFWTRICKPVLQEGQVCTRHRRKAGHRGLELFQRCSCADGLSCRTLPDAGVQPSSSSLLAAAAKSKFAPSHRSFVALSAKPSPVKIRLHVCQRN
nr:PREDICTED: dickkopf-related protein 2-like [Stegastes partitus]